MNPQNLQAIGIDVAIIIFCVFSLCVILSFFVKDKQPPIEPWQPSPEFQTRHQEEEQP